MRITIIQSEIEEAIAEKVLSQMSINDDMELKIDLSATRGPEGMTATIDVVAKQTLELPKRAGRRTAAPKAADAAPAAQTGDSDADEQQGDDNNSDAEQSQGAQDPTPEVQTEAQSEDAPAAPTNSIFGGLRKPVNEKSE